MVMQLPGSARGKWIKTSGNLNGGSKALVAGWVVSGATPVGISESSGTFTITKPGLWVINCNIAGASGAVTLDMHIGPSGSAAWASDTRSAVANSRSNVSTYQDFVLNSVFQIWVGIGGASAASSDLAGGFSCKAYWLGP